MLQGKYNLLSLPFFAFFSKQAYREVGKNWRGVNLAYLFLLMAICCLPPTLAFRKHIIHSLETSQQYLVNQIPDIRISNGHVMLDQHQPYNITRKDGSTAAIIDTTGSMNYIEDPQVMALLMESSLTVRIGKKSFQTFDLSNVTDFHLDKFIANNWLQTSKDALAPVSYGLVLLFSYIIALGVMLLGAIIGLVLSSFMHGRVSFSSALRIATVAATPSIILIAISVALGIAIAKEIHLAVTLIYLVVGIKACAKPQEIGKEKRIDLQSYLHDEAVIETQHAA